MITSIPDSELVLMQIIWQSKEPITSNEIIALLPKDIGWQRTTILTLLSRLVDKKAISGVKKGKNYYYTALIDEEDYKNNETKAFVQKIHGNKLSSFAAALCSDEVFSDEEINQLKELLVKNRREAGK